MYKDQLDTPVLVVDLHILEQNIRDMADWCRRHEVGLRPHFKVHRCIDWAKRQMAAGALGITAATLPEAELLVDSGITDVLIANEVVGPGKERRLARLARGADVKVQIDSHENARMLSEAARLAGTRIGVLVEVDMGMDRCGVAGTEAAVRLARRADRLPGLQLLGVSGYAGQLENPPRTPEKNAAIHHAVRGLLEAAEAIRQAGMDVPIVSTGGTGSFHAFADIQGATELQLGSYLVMDDIYTGAGVTEFGHALRVIATVISVRGQRVIGDAGSKSLAARLAPRVLNHPGLFVEGTHTEHTIMLADGRSTPEVGDRIELSVPTADGTINLHSTVYGLRGEVVEKTFRIEGREHCA